MLETKTKTKTGRLETKTKTKTGRFETKTKAKTGRLETKTKTKTRLNWPRVVSRPRPRSRGLQHCIATKNAQKFFRFNYQ